MSDDDDLRALRAAVDAQAARLMELEAACRALAELLAEARVECRAAQGVHVHDDDEDAPLH